MARNEHFFFLRFQWLAILLKTWKLLCSISYARDQHLEKLYNFHWVLVYLISIWAKIDR